MGADLFRDMVRNEGTLSTVVAACLRAPSGLDAFLRVVEESPVPDRDAAEQTRQVCSQLRRPDAGVEIAVEPHVANAGNLDIAVFSRTRNVCLGVETKNGSQLSTHQVTKYRCAMRDADPRWDSRRIATVVLCPSAKALHPHNDPTGVARSAIVTFRELARAGFADLARSAVPAVRDDILGFFDEVLGGDRPVSAARAQADVSGHRALVERIRTLVRDHYGWRPGTSETVIHRDRAQPKGWTVAIGKGCRSHILIGLPEGERFPPRPGAPDRLWDLAGGYGSMAVPEPFPAARRPWDPPEGSSPDARDLDDQITVLDRFLRHALEVVA